MLITLACLVREDGSGLNGITVLNVLVLALCSVSIPDVPTLTVELEMKYTRVIGIDPDVDKSGVSEVHVETRKVNMSSLTFPQLMDYLQYMQKEYGCREDERMVVVVEAGWMNANNWHTSRVQSVAAAAKTGQNTGRNHEVARKIAEMARHYGMDVIEAKPLRKCWKGKDGKITHEELSMIIGGIDKRTNSEQRDACLLAWVYAGLSIKLKKIKYYGKRN